MYADRTGGPNQQDPNALDARARLSDSANGQHLKHAGKAPDWKDAAQCDLHLTKTWYDMANDYLVAHNMSHSRLDIYKFVNQIAVKNGYPDSHVFTSQEARDKHLNYWLNHVRHNQCFALPDEYVQKPQPKPELPTVPAPVVPDKPQPELPAVPAPVVPDKPPPELPAVPAPVVRDKPPPELPSVPAPVVPDKPQPELPAVPAPVVPPKAAIPDFYKLYQQADKECSDQSPVWANALKGAAIGGTALGAAGAWAGRFRMIGRPLGFVIGSGMGFVIGAGVGLIKSWSDRDDCMDQRVKQINDMLHSQSKD